MTARVYRADDAPAPEPAPTTGVHRRVDRAEVEALTRPLVLATCGHTVPPSETRRGLCRTCYRKLAEHGCPLPPRGSRWDDHDALAAWVRTLDEATRARLLAALLPDPAVPVTVPPEASPAREGARTLPEEPAP